MPSLNSSVGSRSSFGRQNPHHQAARPLHLSWILRLGVRPLSCSALENKPPSPPPASGPTGSDHNPLDQAAHLRTISTEESRIPSSISNLRSVFSHRLVGFCREHPDRQEGNSVDHRRRSVVGFGPFQVRTETGVRPPVASVVPLPWMASSTINPDPLGPDPDWNLYESRGFGLTMRETRICHDTPNFANFRGFFQQTREELGRKVGLRSNIIGSSGGHQRHDFELVPAEKSGTRADAENQCGIRPSRFYQFSPLILRHDRSRGSEPNSSTRMTGAEEVCDLVDSKFVDFNLDLFLNLNHPSPIGSEHGCSSSRRSPLYAQDLNYNAQEQRWFEQEQHLSVDPWREAGNIDGSKCISMKSWWDAPQWCRGCCCL